MFWLFLFSVSLVGYEGLEVIIPDGGTEDSEVEAQKGRWKQELHWYLFLDRLNSHSYLSFDKI